MSCNNCSHSYSHSNCRCGTSDTYVFNPKANCHHCPEPPPVKPCGYTDDGLPVWHELHPLIPMAGEMLCGIETCLSLDQLACNLRAVECFYSTCDLYGDKYYQAIIYHALALGDLTKRLELYFQGIAMGIAIGKESRQPVPDIYSSGYFGLQLKSLLDSIPKQSFITSI